jgi:CubicO group peptidase (beta-lactamase class C family)
MRPASSARFAPFAAIAVLPRLLVAAIMLGVCPLSFLAAAEPAPKAQVLAGSLQPFVDNQTLAGAVVLVANRDRVLDVEAVGYQDMAAKSLMGTNNLFWIASMSKPITATALMMLVDEGKLKLADPVGTYLPEFRDVWVQEKKDGDHLLLRRPRRPITVRDILSHTSGLPFASALERPTLDLLPLRVAAGSYAMTPLLFDPGSKWQYSNAGINTAGRIIEVVSHMPYETFLQKRLFDPLGMKDTTFWPNEEQVKRLVKSYRPGPGNKGLVETTIGQLKYPLSNHERQPMPAGGLFSTAQDLGRFCRMLLNGGQLDGKRYLSEAALKEMTGQQGGAAGKARYGLGWSTDGVVFGHGGAFATNMTVDTKRGLVMIFMVQHAGFPGDGARSRSAFEKAALEQFGGQ